MANFLKLLRNATLYGSHADALNGLKSKLTALTDGEIAIASYGESWESAKTIMGVVRVKDGKTSYTIFDNEDITSAIEALDKTTSGQSSDEHVKVTVIEEDGLVTGVTVETKDIASAELLGTTGDTSGDTTAFGFIAKEKAEREAAIDALDATESVTGATENQYAVLTGISQVDGKLSGHTEVLLATVAKTGEAKDVTTPVLSGDTTISLTGTTVEGQISEIATAMKSMQTSTLKYKTVALTEAEIAALPDGANVKEAYKVVSYTGDFETATDKTTVGDIIKVYKDSSLKSAEFVSEKPGTEGETVKGNFLKLTYILADGSESVVYVDMSQLIDEQEVENGIQSVNHKLSIKLDAKTEEFLTVGADGLKLSGVQDAIDEATSGLVSTIVVNGVTGVTSAHTATVEIEAKDVNVSSGFTTTTFPENLSGATAIASGDTLEGALHKVETTVSALTEEVIDNERVAAEAIIKVAEAAGVKGDDDSIGYVAKSDANYISDATSVHDATVKLDTALKTIEDLSVDAVKEVFGSDAITVTEKNEHKQQTVSLKLDASKTGNAVNALSITADEGLYLSSIWDCGEY